MSKNRESTSQLCLDGDFGEMQDFSNPTGTEHSKKPHQNGGKNEHNGADDGHHGHTTVQMGENVTHTVEAKKDIDGPDDDEAKDCMQIENITERFLKFVKEKKALLKGILYGVLFLLYLAYLVYISVRDIQEAGMMLLLTGLFLVTLAYVFIRDNFGDSLSSKCCKPSGEFVRSIWDFGKWIILAVCLVGSGIGLYFLSRGNPKRLISAFGLLVFVLFTFIFSKHPRHVKWRPVLWGIVLQFIFGFFILRTRLGLNVFQCLGDVTQSALGYSSAGSEFVFGDDAFVANFAFQVLPVVIYFSAVISVLYHLGIMRVVIEKIAWLMHCTMKTTSPESLNAAGNIFIGQTEAPLLIRPLIKDMTKSELHAVMTGGFATIAGSVLGAYIVFGISASHLLSASVMSAPAALAISKLFYPETKKSPTEDVHKIELPKSEHRNVIEAASYGANIAVSLALNIAGNLIAILAVLALLNGILSYLGGLAGVPDLSFEWICSYLFIPIAFLMGVDTQDCMQVARLVGLKTFVNEFFAYEELSKLISNRLNGIEPSLSIRSEVIATYALCGFANIGSIGIQLGGLTPLAPSRKSDITKVAVRALIAGTIACFMTACVAGVLYDETAYDGGMGTVNNTMSNICRFGPSRTSEGSKANHMFSPSPPNFDDPIFPTLQVLPDAPNAEAFSASPSDKVSPSSPSDQIFSTSPIAQDFSTPSSDRMFPSFHNPTSTSSPSGASTYLPNRASTSSTNRASTSLPNRASTFLPNRASTFLPNRASTSSTNRASTSSTNRATTSSAATTITPSSTASSTQVKRTEAPMHHPPVHHFPPIHHHHG